MSRPRPHHVCMAPESEEERSQGAWGSRLALCLLEGWGVGDGTQPALPPPGLCPSGAGAGAGCSGHGQW